MDSYGGGFADSQRSFFEAADESHFRWQTENPLIASTERELLDGFPLVARGAVLEVGCGEGGNLCNLFSDAIYDGTVVGVDLFERKVAFARNEVSAAKFICGDALALPFRDHAFDAILCRDLLHHLETREPALRELGRVCKPGGQIWILEPNGRNPLMRLLAAARPHERGLLRNSQGALTDLVGSFFPKVQTEARQPMPIYRMLLHYQLGLPRLGESRGFGALMRRWDRAAAQVLPRKWWAYILIRVTT